MKLAVLTTGRQDWGLLRSSCRAMGGDAFFALRILAGGMMVSRRFGRGVDELGREGFAAEELAWLREDSETPAEEQASGALLRIGEALRRDRPEALLLAGDRLETAAAAMAATLLGVPVVHLHGGEETEGAFDNQLRHATTKLSHLHLVSHPDHAARVIQMGEDPASVHVVGAPGLDNLRRDDLPGREELERSLGLPLRPPVVVVTVHPATLGADPAAEAAGVVACMDAVPATYVITLPNADPGRDAIRSTLAAAAAAKPGRVAVEALGERRYWGLLRIADAMLGNSSSGLIEAPAVALPAVNVGDRQKGRIRGANVIDVEPGGAVEALRRALAPGFRAGLAGTPSPFGDGRSAPRIAAVLRAWTPPRPPRKRFVGR